MRTPSVFAVLRRRIRTPPEPAGPVAATRACGPGRLPGRPTFQRPRSPSCPPVLRQGSYGCRAADSVASSPLRPVVRRRWLDRSGLWGGVVLRRSGRSVVLARYRPGRSRSGGISFLCHQLSSYGVVEKWAGGTRPPRGVEAQRGGRRSGGSGGRLGDHSSVSITAPVSGSVRTSVPSSWIQTPISAAAGALAAGCADLDGSAVWTSRGRGGKPYRSTGTGSARPVPCVA